MIQASVAKPRPEAESAETDFLDSFLRLAGNVFGTRVVVIANHGLEMLCALIRRGSMAATAIRPGNKSDANSSNLMLIPASTEFSSLEQLIRVARGSLMPGGRLIVGVPADAGGQTTSPLARRLRLNGFGAWRVVRQPELSLLSAELNPSSPIGPTDRHKIK